VTRRNGRPSRRQQVRSPRGNKRTTMKMIFILKSTTGSRWKGPRGSKMTLMHEVCPQCGNRIDCLRISLREVAGGALCEGCRRRTFLGLWDIRRLDGAGSSCLCGVQLLSSDLLCTGRLKLQSLGAFKRPILTWSFSLIGMYRTTVRAHASIRRDSRPVSDSTIY
jgi:hypothetical protein